MRTRLVASAVALFAGSVMLTAAAFAGGRAEPQEGGTLRLSKSTDVDYVDPALAYFTDSFGMIGYATCAKLYNYPDAEGDAGTLVRPEVAAAFPEVSRRGRTHTIRVRRGFRFHTGELVTARSYARAFNRNANPKMQSPATSYMHEIEGVDQMLDGKAKRISGVRTPDAYTLVIRTTKPVPDFVARLTMSFFCPVAVGTPIEPDGINDPAGSGPYYVAERVVNRRMVLKRNPFYRGDRPRNFAQIVWTIGPSLESCRLMVERDETDYCVDGVPPTAYKELADKYGVNKGRFFFNLILGISYFALNHDRPAFKNNLPLRKAINYALDRPSLVRAGGYLGGIRTDQILPPALGSDADLYPLQGPDVEKARALARGHMPRDPELVLYTSTRGARGVRAQLLQYQLKQIALDVQIRTLRGIQHQSCSNRFDEFDLCDEGWLVDYPDAVTFFDPLLNGERIQATGNSNTSYFNDPDVNRRIERIKQMPIGDRRRRAWAQLDVDVMRDKAPIAPFLVLANRDFVSKSVGCYLFHPVMQFDLAAACPR